MRLTRFLILSFVTVCYLQAALEINTEGTENVWGDTYDMYVCSGSFTHQAAFKKENATDLKPGIRTNAFPVEIFHATFADTPLSSLQEHQRIFLELRALRI